MSDTKLRTAHGLGAHLAASCLLLVLATLCGAPSAKAHQPVIEPPQPGSGRPYEGDIRQQALAIKDPAAASQAIYGRLGTPGEIDFYTFTTATGGSLPFEVLVPARGNLERFHPVLVVVGRDLPTPDQPLPFTLPDGQGALVIPPPDFPREIFFEPYSVERLFHGRQVAVTLQEGQVYVIAVYDADLLTGDYAIGVGTVEYFGDRTAGELLSDVLRAKLGLVGGRDIPWRDLAALLLVMAGIASMLGAQAVHLTHSLTARMIGSEGAAALKASGSAIMFLSGLVLTTLGALILYRTSGPSGVAVFQILLVGPLLFGAWMIRRARTAGRRGLLALMGHLLVSFAGLGIAALFSWHVLMLM